jgi:hypothetical protein
VSRRSFVGHIIIAAVLVPWGLLYMAVEVVLHVMGVPHPHPGR